MKARWNQRIIILFLLGLTLLSRVLFLCSRIGSLPLSFDKSLGLSEDVPNVRFHSDGFRLNSLNQEGEEGRKEPVREILKDRVLVEPLLDGHGSADKVNKEEESDRRATTPGHRTPTPGNEKIRDMWDQLILARAYLQFAPPNSNSRLVRELKLRMKEIKSVVGQISKDSDLPRSAAQKMKAMRVSLSRASRAYPDCPALATKLRAMAYNSEEQLRAQRDHVAYLVDLSAKTVSKGFHCLSMTLTSRYFDLQPEQRELPKKNRARCVDLFHVAIFSDNILACSVVVKSTVSSSADPSKFVFHVVTDPLSYPAMTMWFLMNPPRPASVHVASTEDFGWLPVDFDSKLRRPSGVHPRFFSPLNHLRFYLPQVFPFLRKVVLIDHDVVVRKDLSPLWRVDLKGKVNGAVETPLKLESFVDLGDPVFAGRFDPKSSAWAFGLNIFDLDQWRHQGLTEVYQKWLQLAAERPTWKAGTIPLGLLTFYNQTRPLRQRWHLQGLGRAPGGATRADVESAATIHYDGSLKPWLDIGLPNYKTYWTRFVDYGHPLLRSCNIQN